MAEQMIRVSGKGDFGQLQRGLKNLQGDLRSVIGEVDRGARKGGLFDKAQLRALDLYKERFKNSLEEVNKEFERQNSVIDRLHRKLSEASGAEKDAIREQIQLREKELDVIRRQLFEMEKMYDLRTKEASGYGTASGGGGIFGFGGASGGSGILHSLLGGLATVGKFALGMAGIGGLLTMASRAYQLAYQRDVESLDLAQRIRGAGFGSSARDMHASVASIGRRSGMGYTAEESWALQDVYTQSAGALGASQQYALQRFSRGYGLEATQVGALAGNVRQLGGVTSPKEFADLIATSVSRSGMLPRIVEVMQTHTGLLQQLNTSFKDGASKDILAYQTLLDRIGTTQGMMRLTGQQGASLISGLAGIFSPQQDKWKWLGIQALKNYDIEKYGNMGLYELERAFEDGLLNPDNVPAMLQLIKHQMGGNTVNEKRAIQSWLQEGGYNATKREVDELYSATQGMTVFNPQKLNEIMRKIDSGAKYEERQNEPGQLILDTEARFQELLTQVGQPLLKIVQEIKSTTVNGLERAIEHLQGLAGNETVQSILDFLKENWQLIGIGAISATVLSGLASGMIGGLSAGLLSGLGSKLLAGGASGGLLAGLAPFIAPALLVGGTLLGSKLLSDKIKENSFTPEEQRQQNEMLKRQTWGIDDYNDYTKSWFDPELPSNLDKILKEPLDTFSTTGMGHFRKLEEASLEAYRKGNKDVEDFKRKGSEALEDFNKDASRQFKVVRETTEESLGEVEKEHKGLVVYLKTAISTLIEDIKIASDGISFGSVGNLGVGGTFFEGWEKRITSRFRANESFRGSPHGGLDIGGKQGDKIEALASGTISFITEDWGNKTAGGTSIGVRMADGSEYIYRHLSGINPAILDAYNAGKKVNVSAGDWLANVGGQRGAPGSGYNTTGSHLHLEYKVDGKKVDPEKLLQQVLTANSNARAGNVYAGGGGYARGVGGTEPLDFSAFDSTKRIEVSVNLAGDGVPLLNSMTSFQLRDTIERVIREIEEDRLLVNPTVRN